MFETLANLLPSLLTLIALLVFGLIVATAAWASGIARLLVNEMIPLDLLNFILSPEHFVLVLCHMLNHLVNGASR